MLAIPCRCPSSVHLLVGTVAMRFRLRTLMIVLALGPPVLAGILWFTDLPQPERNELQRLLLVPLGLLAFGSIAVGAMLSFLVLVGLAGYCLSVIVKAFLRLVVSKQPNVPFHDPRCAVVDGGGGCCLCVVL